MHRLEIIEFKIKIDLKLLITYKKSEVIIIMKS